MSNDELHEKLLLIQKKIDNLANKLDVVEQKLNDNIEEAKQIKVDLSWIRNK